jgi:hypothetical protein
MRTTTPIRSATHGCGGGSSSAIHSRHGGDKGFLWFLWIQRGKGVGESMGVGIERPAVWWHLADALGRRGIEGGADDVEGLRV